MIDEHAGELVAHRAVHDGGGDGRVDTAGQGADHPGAADLGAHRRDLLGEDALGCPVGSEIGDVVQEVLEDLLTVLGVQHLRVELHPSQPGGAVLVGGDRGVGGGRGDGESVRRLHHGVTVAHPHGEPFREVAEQRGILRCDGQLRRTVFAAVIAVHLAAERRGHGLEAVADAEDGHAGIEQSPVYVRCAVRVHAGRPARKDHRRRVFREQRGERRGARDDLRVHVGLADPARDQLRVLGAEVDHHDRAVGIRGGVHRGRSPCVLMRERRVGVSIRIMAAARRPRRRPAASRAPAKHRRI